PAALPILDLGLLYRDGLDDLRNLPIEVGHRDVGPDVVDRPSDVGGQHVQDVPRLGREAADPSLDVEDDDGDVDSDQQVEEVAVRLRDLLIAAVELVVDGGQLFVDRLQLLFGRLELLVEALKL